MKTQRLRYRQLGTEPYSLIWQAMRDFTEERGPDTPDELWLLEHPPVYTLGLNGDSCHLLKRSATTLVKTDRGGQITWHGPGQLIIYTLIDLRRLNLGVRDLVRRMERAVIGLLRQYAILAETRQDAPGVYIDGRKIASIGLRVRKGCTYHGLSLNINPDLRPFDQINPCGFSGLKMTSLALEGIDQVQIHEVGLGVATALSLELGHELNPA